MVNMNPWVLNVFKLLGGQILRMAREQDPQWRTFLTSTLSELNLSLKPHKLTFY